MKEEEDENMQKDSSKLCGVCGDKALGYNFNAVSCESCKAFFRRNALKNKDFRCPFTENCYITPVTRRFCQKCRLDKCFTIGMRKEYIMSEEDKVLKRQKIEQNRAKKRTQPDIPKSTKLKRDSSLLDSNLDTDTNVSNDSYFCWDTSDRHSRLRIIDSPSPISTASVPSPSPPDGADIVGTKTLDMLKDTMIGAGNGLLNYERVRINHSSAMSQEDLSLDKFSSEEDLKVHGSLEVDRNLSPIDNFDVDTEKYAILEANSPDFHAPLTILMDSNAGVRLNEETSLISLMQPMMVNESLNRHKEHTAKGADLITKLLQSPELLAKFLSDGNIISKIFQDPEIINKLANDPQVMMFMKENEDSTRTSRKNSGASDVELAKALLLQNELSDSDVNRMMNPEDVQPKNPILTNLIKNHSQVACSKSNNNNCHEESSSCQPESPSNDAFRDIQSHVLLEPQNDRFASVKPIESIISKALRLEFSAFSTFAIKTSHNSRELNDLETAKLNELIVANKALSAPLQEDLSNLLGDECKFKENSTDADPALLDVINLTALAIRRLIKMSKKISAFKNMCQDDQLALLKGGCTEMMMLRSALNYDPEKDIWKIPHSKDQLSKIKVEVLKEAKGNLYAEHSKFIRTFDPSWRDENIILILSAIALFTPDRPKVVHREVIKFEQNAYYYLLRRYLESVYPGCEAKSTFLKLIAKISELHKLNDEVVGVYLNVNPSNVEPLLIEIFDLKP